MADVGVPCLNHCYLNLHLLPASWAKTSNKLNFAVNFYLGLGLFRKLHLLNCSI